MATGEIVAGCVVFFGSLALYIVATRFPELGGYESLGPDFWPRWVLGGLVVLGLLLVGQGLERKRTGADVHLWKDTKNPRRLLTGIALLLGYLALINVLGFTLATLLFLVLLIYVLGGRHVTALAVAPVVVTAAILLIFGRILFVPLPRGIGVFRDISLWVEQLL